MNLCLIPGEEGLELADLVLKFARPRGAQRAWDQLKNRSTRSCAAKTRRIIVSGYTVA